MTTYVLHGGKTSIDNSENDYFFHQFTDLVEKDTVRILFCYWARDRKQWENLKKRDIEKILRNTKKFVEFRIVEKPYDVLASVYEFDVLYVSGGEAEFIEPFYPDLQGLKEKLDNKVYIGSSMGTFLASEYYMLSLDNQDSFKVHKGCGLLPIQTLCHWNVEKQKNEKLKLLKSNSTLPILVLEEYKFVTIYNNNKESFPDLF